MSWQEKKNPFDTKPGSDARRGSALEVV